MAEEGPMEQISLAGSKGAVGGWRRRWRQREEGALGGDLRSTRTEAD